ncbi:antibiotic biosynthesis monooxygenase family protein [Amycolatopsis sp.]|uniref:antibiotic biosynthesis monooxygenase family protein n=1 Tax=Amycolatopsis sp. TaxID=37632 RepID=UPI002BDB0856|nr:antibiotic biosynthesis monooxygenase family protein [Amycolatopsis sp.]HVV13424.1 antibiotic biosynthesis monooxygenase family protein [Amycolatopsis sp.]
MQDTTITAGDPVTTLINVFTVRPEHQRGLVETLTRATEERMRHVPGFVSANIHAADDGTKVVNYAQWESAEHYRAMLADPANHGHMREAAALAESFEPHLYTVESVHHS